MLEASSQVSDLPHLTSLDIRPSKCWNSPDLKFMLNIHTHSASSSQALLVTPLFSQYSLFCMHTQFFRDFVPGREEQGRKKWYVYTTVIIRHQKHWEGNSKNSSSHPGSQRDIHSPEESESRIHWLVTSEWLLYTRRYISALLRKSICCWRVSGTPAQHTSGLSGKYLHSFGALVHKESTPQESKYFDPFPWRPSFCYDLFFTKF